MELAPQTCRKCGSVLSSEATICACGTLTALASFKQRIDHELAQWKAYKARTSAETV